MIICQLLLDLRIEFLSNSNYHHPEAKIRSIFGYLFDFPFFSEEHGQVASHVMHRHSRLSTQEETPDQMSERLLPPISWSVPQLSAGTTLSVYELLRGMSYADGYPEARDRDGIPISVGHYIAWGDSNPSNAEQGIVHSIDYHSRLIRVILPSGQFTMVSLDEDIFVLGHEHFTHRDQTFFDDIVDTQILPALVG